MFKKLFSRQKKETLDKGLEKTKESVFSKLSRAIAGKSTVDSDVLDELEEALITSDVGVKTTIKIIERIEARVAKDKYINTSELNTILQQEIADLLEENNSVDQTEFSVPSENKPHVVMVVGVNGVGKTTTIGKLAHQFKQNGKKVMLGAADTFRAAAVDQLEIWKERAGVEIISKGMNTDPSAVAYDAVKYFEVLVSNAEYKNDALLGKGTALARMGEVDNALEVLGQIDKASEPALKANVLKAGIQIGKQQLEEAEASAKKALEMDGIRLSK